jgi:hypothetical protein
MWELVISHSNRLGVNSRTLSPRENIAPQGLSKPPYLHPWHIPGDALIAFVWGDDLVGSNRLTQKARHLLCRPALEPVHRIHAPSLRRRRLHPQQDAAALCTVPSVPPEGRRPGGVPPDLRECRRIR